MPEASRFLAIVGMFYREHGMAHFHAVYGAHEISDCSMGREVAAVSSALLALVILYTVAMVARLESRGSQLGRGDIR